MKPDWKTLATRGRRALGPVIIVVLLGGLIWIPLERTTTRHRVLGALRNLAWAERYHHEGSGRYFSSADLVTAAGQGDVFSRAFGALGFAVAVRVEDDGQRWEALIWSPERSYRVTSVPAFRVSVGPGHAGATPPDPGSLDWETVDTTLY